MRLEFRDVSRSKRDRSFECLDRERRNVRRRSGHDRTSSRSYRARRHRGLGLSSLTSPGASPESSRRGHRHHRLLPSAGRSESGQTRPTQRWRPTWWAGSLRSPARSAAERETLGRMRSATDAVCRARHLRAIRPLRSGPFPLPLPFSLPLPTRLVRGYRYALRPRAPRRVYKRRYYRTAVGSATESAAIYDVLLRLKLISTERHTECKAMLDRIASMLVKMAKNLQVNACAKSRDGQREGEREREREGAGEAACSLWPARGVHHRPSRPNKAVQFDGAPAGRRPRSRGPPCGVRCREGCWRGWRLPLRGACGGGPSRGCASTSTRDPRAGAGLPGPPVRRRLPADRLRAAATPVAAMTDAARIGLGGMGTRRVRRHTVRREPRGLR
jgi:hypothetical protein